MIVAVDVGNTTVKMGLFERRQLLYRLAVPSDSRFDAEEYWSRVRKAFEPTPQGGVIEGVIMCSVVPSLTPVLSEMSVEKLGRKPIIFDASSRIGLVNRYRPPEAVGADRLANAFAVWKVYGVPAIVVDIGTAITVDAISKDAEYLGGVIAPGVEMAAEALNRKTALLPHVTLEPVKGVLGSDTVCAIRSGLTHGYAAMIAGLVKELKDELGFPKRTTTVLTGGHVGIFGSLLSELPLTVDPDLTLNGLNLIYCEMTAGARSGGA